MAGEDTPVPAGSNPDYRSENAVPVHHDARAVFQDAVPMPMYEVSQGPREIPDEPTLDERFLASDQAEQARLAKLRELGIEPGRDTSSFRYADEKVVSGETSEVLDFEDDVVDENGDIVDEEEFSIDPELLATAVPAPRRGPGRPRKS